MKKNICACLAIVFVWFTSAFGAGVASGAHAYAFYARHGWTGLWLPAVGLLFTAGVGWLAVEYARPRGIVHYRAFIEDLYGSKWIARIYEFGGIYGTVIGVATVLAAGGSLFETLGINYWPGVILVSAICIFGCLFGAGLVRKSASAMGIIIVLLLAIVFFCVVRGRGDVVTKIVSERQVYTSLGSAWYWAVYFGGSNCAMLVSLLPLMDKLKTKADTTFMTVVGLIVCSFVTYMISYCILAYMPEAGKAAMPFHHVIAVLDNSFFTVAYSIVMFCAIVTTGVGLLYTYVVRFGPYVKIKSDKLRSISILMFFVVVAAVISSMGIVALVSKAIIVTVYINVALLMIGLPIQFYKKRHETKRLSMVNK